MGRGSSGDDSHTHCAAFCKRVQAILYLYYVLHREHSSYTHTAPSVKDYALQRYCTGGCMDASQISQCNANIQVTDDDKKRCTTFQSAIVSLLIHIQIIYHDQVSLCVQRYLAQKTLCGSAPFLQNVHIHINITTT